MPKAAVIAMFVLGCTVATDTSSDPVVQAFRFFEALGKGDADAILRTLRPPPLGPRLRAHAIALLPERGRLGPDHDERTKLAMLKHMLIYHERDEVFTITVIDVPQAAVALHQRAVLLISRPALRVISATELQALVAHEVGHDFFWQDFEDTFARGDKKGLRELELKCDGIAVFTLIALGLDPATLTHGLRKIAKLNETIGAHANADEYPTLQQPHQLIKELYQRYRVQ